MTQPTVVVTGAGGFLGRRLVAVLVRAGASVRAVTRSNSLDSPDVEVVRANVTDSAALARAFRGAEAVFHLAAHVHDTTSRNDESQQREITVGSAIAALRAAEVAGTRSFILASSLAVYGDGMHENVDENQLPVPNTPYGRAKLESEQALVDFATRGGAFAASIRPAVIYGVNAPGNLARMIRAVDAGWFPPIPEFGNRRSMVWVDDVANAMILAWKARIPGGRWFNITDGEGYSTRRVYDLIRQALGRSPPSFAIPRSFFSIAATVGDFAGALSGRRFPFDTDGLDSFTGSAYFTSARARAELGFVPSTTLPQIMPAMVQSLVGSR